MPKNIPVFLGDIRIGTYTEEDTLGIDPQAAVAALRHILFEKTPTATVDATNAVVAINADDPHGGPSAKVQAVRIMTKIGVEVETHYSEEATA